MTFSYRIMSLLLAVPLFFLPLSTYAGTTGKIAGTVTDAKTGEKLVGVTVVVEGTKLGASTDLNGYYVILNVPPGTYRLRASMVGYASTIIENVRVDIDQTTEVNLVLSETAITTQEVTVIASRPVIQKDVSASTTNLSANQVQSIPTVSVATVVGLQAGIQPGLVVRGGGSDQTAFMVDGFTLRDERNNTPYTTISYTSIKDIQIQTGGFNAEYGNIRSGIVNVVTRDGSTDHYTLSVITRISPPQPKHFGDAFNSMNFYWVRPYMDPAVAWTGTQNGAWDAFTQSQYPQFQGWIAVAQKSLQGGDSTKYLTPTAAQRLWEWQHRKSFDILKPDFNIDASFGGPFPFISKELGNLRFWASYTQQRSMYLIPLSKDSYQNYNGSLKLTSDVGSGKVLTIEGMLGQQAGTNNNNAGLPGIFTSSSDIASQLTQVSYIDARMFTYDYWAPSRVNFNMLGAKFSHVISPSTFYEISLREFGSQYHTAPGPLRDTSRVYLFGNSYYTDEAPVGFWPQPSYAIDGMRMSVGMSNSRDSSKVSVLSARVDLTSQVDRYNQFKTGLEFVYTDNNVSYASVDQYLPSGRSWSHWHTFPIRGAFYLQDKLEFEGMIANLGVRVDYSHAGGYWYKFTPYDPAFSGALSLGLDTLLQHEPTKQLVMVSPRLGISFPITVDSKLYFNYGHFYSMPSPDDLFLIRRFSDNNAVTRIADPNAPLPRTIAYELGYEQSLFNQFLIHAAAYYKDVSHERTLTTYISADTKENYNLSTSNLYEDIRGFEITLSKNRGDWIQGFVNYTYMVSSYGRFGWATYYQSPADMRNYMRTNYTDLYQQKPVPRPYARLNLDFFTPSEFGPDFSGIKPFSDWHINLLGSWQAGQYFTWAGGGSLPGVVNNVQWRDYINFDLRISRAFRFAGVDLEAFADIYNIFNIKYMSPFYGFYDYNDFLAYMKSLHLPASIAGDSLHPKLGYINTPGNDRPGDYKSASKPYIDMPNLWQLAFLNPRSIFYGIRFTYNLP